MHLLTPCQVYQQLHCLSPQLRKRALYSRLFCVPFTLYYFVKTNHALNTRNNQSSVQLSRMKLEIGRQNFFFLAALCFNSLENETLDFYSGNSLTNILCVEEFLSSYILLIFIFYSYFHFFGLLCYKTPLITVLLH